MLRLITSPAAVGALASISLILQMPAATVAVFNNDTFVDSTGAGGYPGEATTVRASLNSLGFTTTAFTGFTATDFTAVGNSANAILFPEFEHGDLQAALSPAARTVLANYVMGGGGVIVIGNYTTRDVDFLNGVFGFSLVDSGLALTTLERNATAVAGTPYSTGPASLLFESDTSGIDASSLPAGALNLYSGVDVVTGIEDNAVFVASVGQGRVAYLGWDWFNAQPLGTEDGGWMVTLNTTTTLVAVPEPSSYVLVLAGLAVAVRNHRNKNSLSHKA